MSGSVLEAVPNFSEGRDLDLVRAIVSAAAGAGADILDWSADPDHNRSVVTFVGAPAVVERAAVAAARIAIERIDLRRHRGVHPRIGALDVLPFVPLVGLTMEDARRSARNVGQILAEDVGIPVYFYGEASDPPGRRLAELRRGGFEALREAWPPERAPDLLPPEWPHAGAHPTAGATCVGARPVLLAWNVCLTGITLPQASSIAAAIRERDGGFPGLRALAFALPSRGLLQVSMNLEDPQRVTPLAVFERIEALAATYGGHVVETEVIGMVPDELVFPAAAQRLSLSEAAGARLLSRRLLEHVALRNESANPRK
ncbi:MAG TPA: glutamate formimidoyltransferase [Longimicrobiales bacterium]